MSVLEETLRDSTIGVSKQIWAEKSVIGKFTALISSVRFGVILLCLLVLLCLLGMLIRQHNVTGFQTYYSELYPSQQIIFSLLGLFDIYHTWYFNAVLALLSLNIVLASIDRFPKTWRLISKPKLTPTVGWLKKQELSHSFILSGTKNEISEKLVKACKKMGWRNVIIDEKNGQTFIFAESGAWNRLGAYPVHVALLTIFFGGFLTSQFSFSSEIPINLGQTTSQMRETIFQDKEVRFANRELPFAVTCLDLEQKLINPNGSLETANTLDWLTRLQISDENGVREGVVQLNKPFDYRGYRFFHSNFLPIGKGRTITIAATDFLGKTQNLTIKRNETATLADGTIIRFVDFRANFSLTKETLNENSTTYQNPAAVLKVASLNNSPYTFYALGKDSKEIPPTNLSKIGYRFQLIDFEKVADQHILFVQRNPGANVLYLGFILLFLSILAVFFFSHQRIWAVINEQSENDLTITIAGNTNRNQIAFSDKFKRFLAKLQINL